MSTRQPKKLNSYLLWLLRYEFQKFVPETTWWITCRITWWSLMINKMNQQQVLMIIDNLHLDSRWYQLPLLRYDKLSLDDHWYSWWSLIIIDAHWWSTRWIINKSWWSLTTCIWIHVNISCHCWEIPNSFFALWPNMPKKNCLKTCPLSELGCATCCCPCAPAITTL